MQRRQFLKRTGATSLAVATLPNLIDDFAIKAFAGGDPAIGKLLEANDRILVLIQLPGGNDGLNTIIPFTVDRYFEARPNIAIKAKNVLKLTDTMGMHPRMTGMHKMYKDGTLAIVQGVTYPNPDRSHFRGTDIWLTATDADVFNSTGWVGRYVKSLSPSDPTQLPKHPLAVQIGISQSLALESSSGSMGITLRDPDEFYRLVKDGIGLEEVPSSEQSDTPAGREIAFMRAIAKSANVYASVIKDVANAAASDTSTFPQTDIGAKLRVVSQLIRGGLETRVYLISWMGNSFDTHANQASESDSTQGYHAGLLGDLSDAITVFTDDLKKNNLHDKVVGMTFSEFGRRVYENGSVGTDHGTAAPLFVFGADVDGGKLFGKDPDLYTLDERGDLLMTNDYRDVYSSVLLNWFGNSMSRTQEVLFRDYSKTALPLFKHPITSAVDSQPVRNAIISMGPNPARDVLTLRLDVDYTADVSVMVADIQGRTVLTSAVEAWTGVVHLDTNTLPSGVYVLSVIVNREVSHTTFSVVR